MPPPPLTLISAGAASHALERRAAIQAEQRRKADARAEARRRKAEEALLGRTASGVPVSSEVVSKLVELGYPQPLALGAVRHSNNSLDGALSTLADADANYALQLSLLQVVAVIAVSVVRWR